MYSHSKDMTRHVALPTKEVIAKIMNNMEEQHESSDEGRATRDTTVGRRIELRRRKSSGGYETESGRPHTVATKELTKEAGPSETIKDKEHMIRARKAWRAKDEGNPPQMQLSR